MKQFNLIEFCVHGQKFHTVSLKFTLAKKLEVVTKEEIVHTKNRAPGRGCDFATDTHSYHSKRFYEVSGLPEVSDLFARYGQFTAYFYVLPENLEELKPLAIADFLTQIRAISEKLTAEARTLREALYLCQP